MPEKITSLAGLKKAIEDLKREYAIKEQLKVDTDEEIMFHHKREGLETALGLISEFEAGIREKMKKGNYIIGCYKTLKEILEGLPDSAGGGSGGMSEKCEVIEIVCLIGCIDQEQDWRDITSRLTQEGFIVFEAGSYDRTVPKEIWDRVTLVHQRKIAMSDIVVRIPTSNGSITSGTKSDIEYARKINKKVVSVNDFLSLIARRGGTAAGAKG